MDDEDLYLRSPDDARGETLISGPCSARCARCGRWSAWPTPWRTCPTTGRSAGRHPRLLGPAAGQHPRYVADVLIAERLQPALARLRAASTDRRPVAVAAYTSRPRTTEVAGALRLMLCEQADADCNRLCTARHSDLTSCDGAAGFDDRELFELLLGPGRRSPLYRSSHLAARFALGLATGQEWSHFYYLNGGAEIARVEVPDWLVEDPELLALSHAMLVKQCQLGMGYPVAISEAHEQAVITGHDREEFRRLTLMLLEQQRPAHSGVRQGHIKKSQAPMEGRRLAHVRHRLGHSLAGNPNAVGGPVGNSAGSQGGSDCGKRIRPRQRRPPGRPCHPAIYGSA